MSCQIIKRGTWAKLKKGDARRRLFGRKYKYVVTSIYTFKVGHEYPIFTSYRQHRNQKYPSSNPKFGFSHNILWVYPGYLWDGASGIAIDTKSSMAPSLMHDCAYQAIRQDFIKMSQRKDADEDFRDLLKAEKMRIWCYPRYWVLRLFGKYAAEK